MDATPEPLIPTRHKSPLAKGTSYPVGAELVSRELVDVPQYAALEIGFYGEKCRAFLLDQKFFPVIQVEYKKMQGGYSTANGESSLSRLEPNWQITVHPVLGNERKKFRDYLEQGGWNLIRTWLNDQWAYNGRVGKSCLVISACQKTGEIKHKTEASIMPA